MANSAEDMYRLLPSVHELLEQTEVRSLLAVHSRELVTGVARQALARLRDRLRTEGAAFATLQHELDALPRAIAAELQGALRPGLQRVINATGVILQTNLGRAPLSDAALERIAEVAGGYSNLEFDLDRGERSRRDVHADDLLLRVLRALGAFDRHDQPEAEPLAAAVVNNCAAATFLALNSLAAGGEVIVSRGELVEIGGGFRIPEILAKSGAVLREVGTTNKTRVSDYAEAVGPATKLILRVHRSNFRIEGFTSQPSLEELAKVASRAGVPVFEDQGTGCLLDLNEVGLPGESSLLHSLSAGMPLVAASGDKLLGGPQCGFLVGQSSLVERCRTNPLFRALRVDKLTYAALEATLLAYLSGAEQTIPIVRMMRETPEAIKERCESVLQQLQDAAVVAEVRETRSVVGGGTTPGASLPSFAVTLQSQNESESALTRRLRQLETPIVARVADGRVWLDLRTVDPRLDAQLGSLLKAAVAPPPANREAGMEP